MSLDFQTESGSANQPADAITQGSEAAAITPLLAAMQQDSSGQGLSAMRAAQIDDSSLALPAFAIENVAATNLSAAEHNEESRSARPPGQDPRASAETESDASGAGPANRGTDALEGSNSVNGDNSNGFNAVAPRESSRPGSEQEENRDDKRPEHERPGLDEERKRPEEDLQRPERVPTQEELDRMTGERLALGATQLLLEAVKRDGGLPDDVTRILALYYDFAQALGGQAGFESFMQNLREGLSQRGWNLEIKPGETGADGRSEQIVRISGIDGQLLGENRFRSRFNLRQR